MCEPGNPRRGRRRSGFAQGLGSQIPRRSTLRPPPGIFLPFAAGSFEGVVQQETGCRAAKSGMSPKQSYHKVCQATNSRRRFSKVGPTIHPQSGNSPSRRSRDRQTSLFFVASHKVLDRSKVNDVYVPQAVACLNKFDVEILAVNETTEVIEGQTGHDRLVILRSRAAMRQCAGTTRPSTSP